MSAKHKNKSTSPRKGEMHEDIVQESILEYSSKESLKELFFVDFLTNKAFKGKNHAETEVFNTHPVVKEYLKLKQELSDFSKTWSPKPIQVKRVTYVLAEPKQVGVGSSARFVKEGVIQVGDITTDVDDFGRNSNAEITEIWLETMFNGYYMTSNGNRYNIEGVGKLQYEEI